MQNVLSRIGTVADYNDVVHTGGDLASEAKVAEAVPQVTVVIEQQESPLAVIQTSYSIDFAGSVGPHVSNP